MSPPSLLFSSNKRRNSFCLSSQGRFCSPLIIFVALIWTLSSLSELWGQANVIPVLHCCDAFCTSLLKQAPLEKAVPESRFRMSLAACQESLLLLADCEGGWGTGLAVMSVGCWSLGVRLLCSRSAGHIPVALQLHHLLTVVRTSGQNDL